MLVSDTSRGPKWANFSFNSISEGKENPLGNIMKRLTGFWLTVLSAKEPAKELTGDSGMSVKSRCKNSRKSMEYIQYVPYCLKE